MPAYNVEQYISDAIESIINQTFTSWELLITDDCSTDNTRNIVSKYVEKDNRIKLFFLKVNSGAGAARNNSIDKATGRYIAFCDSDDWWYPYKLEMQYNFMKKNGFEFIFSACEFTNSKLEVTGISWKRLRVTRNTLLWECNIGTPGVVYDTKRIGKIYFPLMRKRQDWVMWLSIIAKTKYLYSINWPLWKCRIRANSLSSVKSSLIKYNIEVYNKILGYSKIKAYIFLLFGYLPNYFYRKIKNAMQSIVYLRLYKK
jgi:glycosyltransferase involved in cell wall biosynthesis